MRIDHVAIQNFRLLSSVDLALEPEISLVLGRNNSGKTSLSEIVRRFLGDVSAKFLLEDFSSACYDDFCTAHEAHQKKVDDEGVRSFIPAIELRLHFKYDPAKLDLGPLKPFVIDLDESCDIAVVVIRYQLDDGAVSKLFAGLPELPLDGKKKLDFFKLLREKISENYGVKIWAEDPNDATNRRFLPVTALRNLVKTGFINAQRGLDDVTTRETDILAKVLESLFTSASSATADASDQVIAEALKTAVQDIQTQIDGNFVTQLQSLLPTLQSFGYPGLGGQVLRTETTLDVARLLSNFTKVRYEGYGGIPLPESYNGLGVRNLIFILLRLVGFFKEFRAQVPTPGVHLIFIEEPEAHLHPQMQEVFIRQLSSIAKKLVESTDDKTPWNVQFIVSTHSSHVANEAGFETIRYFLGEAVVGAKPGVRRTKIKDLRRGLTTIPTADKEFLLQYLTLTRCDLFFADKAVLVEGLSERLMLPVIVKMLENADASAPKLSSQYITIIEVGGAYAHIFLEFLAFLELRSLIVTDIDSVNVPGGTACEVHLGTSTSNGCLKKWFEADKPVSISGLLAKTPAQMTKGINRIAYQCVEQPGGPCGRTFEDAFMIANPAMFGLSGTREQQEIKARAEAARFKKSEFALKYAISSSSFRAPKYIVDGFRWLAADIVTAADPLLGMAVVAAAATTKKPAATKKVGK